MDNTSTSSTTRSSDESRVDRTAAAAHSAVEKPVSALLEQGEHTLRGAEKTAGAITTEAVEHIDRSLSDVKRYISQNPGKSLGIAIVGGCLLSKLLKR